MKVVEVLVEEYYTTEKDYTTVEGQDCYRKVVELVGCMKAVEVLEGCTKAGEVGGCMKVEE